MHQQLVSAINFNDYLTVFKVKFKAIALKKISL